MLLLKLRRPARAPRRRSRVEMTIGIDLGDVWSHYCTLNQDGEVVDRGRFRTTPKAIEILWPIAHRTIKQQEALTLIRASGLLVRLRTAAVNAVRGLTKSCGYRMPASATQCFAQRGLSVMPFSRTWQPLLPSRFLQMPSKLIPQSRKQFIRKIPIPPGTEPLIKRRSQHRSRHSLIDPRLHRPSSLPRI